MKKNELRDRIKLQIQEEIANKLSDNNTTSLDSLYDFEVERRNIFLEERDAFYKNRTGFTKIINEIGEEEWVKNEDLKKREGYLNFEENLEDAESHKRIVIRNLIFYIIIFIMLIGTAYYYLREPKGYIEVNCNLKGLMIMLDGQPTGLTTDNVIEKIKAGKYKLSLNSSGVIVHPEVIEVDLKYDEGTTITFKADSVITDNKPPAEIMQPVVSKTSKNTIAPVKQK